MLRPDFPNRIFYLQFVKGDFNENYNMEGYLELEAEMLFPFTLTPIQQRPFDLSTNNTSTTVKYFNPSNVDKYYKPLIKIELIGNTTQVRIKNLNVNNEEMILSNLTVGETITIDSETQQIESSTGNERISHFNFVYPRLIQGINKLEITGRCKITIISQFPMMI
jgi:phage-related protein